MKRTNIITHYNMFSFLLLAEKTFWKLFLDMQYSSEIAISNISDLKNAVNGMYDLLSSYGYYGGTAFYYGDVKGDDIQSRAQTGRDHTNVTCTAMQPTIWELVTSGTALVYNPTGM